MYLFISCAYQFKDSYCGTSFLLSCLLAYADDVNIVTYWVSLVVLHVRSNNVNVAATINSASCYGSVVTQQ
jgi:hypothetical protein